MSSANISKLKCKLLGHAYRREICEPDKQRYTKDVCYNFIVKCKRCGTPLTVKSLTVDHEFGFFVTSGDEACTQVRTCKICGIIERKEVHVGSTHPTASSNPCLQNLVCDQCGKIIGEKEMHGSTHTTASSNPCMQNLACDQCGKIVGEVESHDYGMPFEARFPVGPDDYYYSNAVKCDRCGYIKQL